MGDKRFQHSCVFILLLTQGYIIGVNCYSTGAPTQACNTMAPDTSNYAHNSQPQTGNSPYSVEVIGGVNTYSFGVPVSGK